MLDTIKFANVYASHFHEIMNMAREYEKYHGVFDRKICYSGSTECGVLTIKRVGYSVTDEMWKEFLNEVQKIIFE